MFKYVLNTGIRNDKYKKVDYLVLLYPGELEESMIENENYAPQVKILPSKPKFERHLEDFIDTIIEKELPSTLYKKRIR
jgi:hypothetical protein